MRASSRQTRPRWAWWLGGLVAAIVVGGVGYLAGRTATTVPGAAVTTPTAPLTVTVQESTVGRSLALGILIRRDVVPVAANALTGTVTAVSSAAEIEVGGELYRVDERTVRAMPGEIPFYRDLELGLSGRDVAQLNAGLSALGHAVEGDTFSDATQRAVMAWQRQIGTPETGRITKGELVALGTLPGQVVRDPALTVGALLDGGERLLSVPRGAPAFELVAALEQSRLIPDTATVTVHWQQHAWPAVITGRQPNQQGQVVFSLAAPGGGAVCGEECGTLPPQPETTVSGDVVVAPEQKGPAVPVAALRTLPDGHTVVTVVAGGNPGERVVTVRGSANGVAVVDGLAVGEQVQVGRQ